MFEKGDKNERLLYSASFTAKFELVFALTQEKRFLLVISFYSQQKKHRLF